MAFFNLTLPTPAHVRDEAFNRGLDMAMDWSEGSHGPTRSKLAKAYPRLRTHELDEIAARSQEAMKFGHELAYELCRQPRAAQDLEAEFRRQLSARYPCATEENVQRLLRQGLYYALKTGTQSGLL